MIRSLIPLSAKARLRHRPITLCLTVLAGVLLSLLCPSAHAQAVADYPLYENILPSYCWNGSWATNNVAETDVVAPGCSEGISVDMSQTPWGGFYIGLAPVNVNSYQSLSFYINGGPTGGQRLSVQALNNYNKNAELLNLASYVPGGSIPANQWVLVTIPLTDLGTPAELSAFTGFWLQDSAGYGQPLFYLDQILLNAPAAPAVVSLSINTNKTLRKVDERVFGVNTATWDGEIDDPATVSLLQAAGVRALRFPGGSTSDAYNWWQQNPNWTNEPQTPQFASLAESLNAQVFMTADYGQGTPQSNAAWVAYCNASPTSAIKIGTDSNGVNWKTAGYWASIRAASPLAVDDGYNFLRASHPAPYGFENWEMGNECYGGWENDTHTPEHDPVVYANIFKQTSANMKRVDPSVKVGIVIAGSEDAYGVTETVTNPITGVQHSGWDAVLYSTLAGMNITPDFVIYHNYAQAPGNESDPFLLQYASGWTGIAQSIRTSLNDYFGKSRATPVQLCCTENNSVYTNPGKQSTSLVNGLFYADSVGQLLQTEFHSLVWWDLHNGEDPTQNNSPLLYGWRNYGSYGILATGSGMPGAYYNTPFPTYYAIKLLQYFARNGDSILPATSSYPGLSIYAAKRANGDITALVINKSPTGNLTANLALTGFLYSGDATEYQYGAAQDTAQSLGNSVDLAVTPITNSPNTAGLVFPSYSMTVLDMAPFLPPASVTATAGPGKSITVQWSAAGGAASYKLLRGTTSGGETLYQSGLTKTDFTDTKIKAGVTYYYKVVAVNPNGTSARSAEASVTL